MGFSPMGDASGSLDDLRRQIDEIDRMLHDLLIRRSEVVEQIGALKGGERDNGVVYLRPGREAIVLRRLIERHRGPLPRATLVRIWRELMSAYLKLQGTFSAAVYAPPNRASGFWDLARDHFGGLTPIERHEKTQRVLGAVIDGEASVGVLPLPVEDEPDHWWRLLMTADTKVPRVVARLPFGLSSSERGKRVEALVVARIPPEETGRDRSLVAVETRGEISRATLAAGFRAEKLEAAFMVSGVPAGERGQYLHLLELPLFLDGADARLARIAEKLGQDLRQVWLIGGYAEPLSAAELGLTQPARGS
jgi:chorismate mutase / prephenate dehydratase